MKQVKVIPIMQGAGRGDYRTVTICSDCNREDCNCEYCEECRKYHARPTWVPGRPCSNHSH